MANGLPVIAVNRVGYESDWSGVTGGIQFWGQSFVAEPFQFSYKNRYLGPILLNPSLS